MPANRLRNLWQAFSVVYIRVLGEFRDVRIENGIGC